MNPILMSPVLARSVFALALLVGSLPVLGAGTAEPQSQSQGSAPVVPADAAEPGAARAAAAFENRPWLLAAYRSGDGLVEVSAEGRGGARFRFEEGRMSGSAGCNRLMGGYSLDGDRLAFEPGMASSMMACPEPLMAQEQAVNAALAAVAGYRLDGKLLELIGADAQPLLRFLALEPSPLTERTWELTGYNNGKQAIVSVLAETRITLELRDDGTLGGSDGCNRYMSGYVLEAERLSIGPLATTRMACRGPQGAAEQAAAYADALGSVAGYRIEGDDLTLLDASGTPAAQFKVEAPPVLPAVQTAPTPSREPPAGPARP